MELTTATYTIPSCNLPLFQERVDVLNKRARKLGVAEIAVTVVFAYLTREFIPDPLRSASRVPRWVKDGEQAPANHVASGSVMQWNTVTVTGEAPKFAGWKFIATLEPLPTDDGTAVNLLQCVPGETCPAEFRSRVGQCDHCNARRNRKQTFVLRHDSGAHKMVGRQCIKDFLGHLDPHQVAAWAEMLVELSSLGSAAEDEGWGGGGRGADVYDLRFILSLTAAVISHYGWISKSAAFQDDRLTATAGRVSYLLHRPHPSAGYQAIREWEAEVAKCQPTDDHKQDAANAVEWARSFSDEQIETNNYLANCNAIARCGVVEGKTMGIACSVVSSFQREQARLKLAEREAARVSNYVGEIGKRAEFVVTVVKVIPCEGSYGTTGLHKMLDDQGNDLGWFASGSAEWLKEGCTYRVKATPKKHEEYRTRKQTMLNRVTVIEEVKAAA